MMDDTATLLRLQVNENTRLRNLLEAAEIREARLRAILKDALEQLTELSAVAEFIKMSKP